MWFGGWEMFEFAEVETVCVMRMIAVLMVVSFLASMRMANKSIHKRIVAGNSPLNNFIASGLQSTLDRYSPTWWTNGHIQAFLTFFVPHAPIKYKRDVLLLKDGGHTSLDWAIESSALQSTTSTRKPLQDNSPIVLIMHGLTGCSADMRSLCAEALQHGYRPVVFNKRGHGGMNLATPKLQAFGCVQDLTEAIEHIEKAYPSSKLYGIGLSAGSALLCSYLGETGDASRLEAGVLISPGYNAFELFCLGRIHRVYDYFMTFTLKKFLLKHERELKHVIDVPKAMAATSIREFDEHVFMKMHGYTDLESYWAHNNPMRAVENIRRPMLCLNALDDPVCTKGTIRYDQFEDNPKAMLVETGKGSHCAFFEGNISLKSWSNEAAIRYLDRLREFQQQRVPTETENSISAAVQC